MKIQDFSFFTDENIDRELVTWLRERGNQVWDIKEKQLWGMSDRDIIALAFDKRLVIISQDSDFGTLVFRDNLEFYGIIYLRPGHQNPFFHIETLNILFLSR